MTNENSLVAQSTTSSASRETSTPIIAATNENSATKSRLAVPSIEFSTERVEAEVGGDGLGVEPERGAGQRARAVRRHGGAHVPVAQPLDVAQQRPGVGQQVVRRAAPAGRAGGGCGPGIATPRWRVGLVDEGVDDVEHQAGDDPRVLAQVHPEQGGHLVVARAPGAQPAADVGAGPVDEAALEGGVHVLVGLVGR